MTEVLERVISCQERLIDALDRRDVAAVETATADLEVAVDRLTAIGAIHARDGSDIDFALRQSNAARIRVNLLADWTRHRIDRLSEIRGQRALTYGKHI